MISLESIGIGIEILGLLIFLFSFIWDIRKSKEAYGGIRRKAVSKGAARYAHDKDVKDLTDEEVDEAM